MLQKIIMAIVVACAVSIALMSIFTFLGTPLETYANYIIWMDALVVFYIVLPGKQNTIFNQ